MTTQEMTAPAAMSTFELLAHLRGLDVRLRAEDGQLRFSAPKGALTVDLRAELARRKQEVLAVLRAAGDDGGEPIGRAPRDGELPLSFSQMRIWFLEQLEPGTTAWHLPEAARLRGPLEVGALRRSLHEVVRRHESLRTTFDSRAGQPIQVIAREQRLDVPVVDLERLPREVGEGVTERLALCSARRTFDLKRGPLIRTLLLRIAAAEHVFLVNIHHLVFDRWSMGVFLGEMAALYAAFSAGRPSPLPEPAVQYADFAHWQRQRLRGETLEGLLGYWRRQLAGVPGALPLPTDRPRPPFRTETGARRRVALSAALTSALRRLCTEHGVTLFMALLAACDVLLWRLTGRRDLCVGTVIANRVRPELESLIGYLLNTLVLRADLRGDPGFDALLERTRQAALGAYAHQELPFERLIADLRPERELAYAPFFQVMSVVQNTPAPGIDLAGLDATVLDYGGIAAANSDLGFWTWEEDGRLAGYVEYNTTLFDAVSALRTFGELRTLLEAVVRRPEQRISELPVLPAAARHQLFVEWNDVPAPRADGAGFFHELFESRVERGPEATAVVLEETALSYGELNARANRLARLLRRLGVGPEVRVAVFLEYSLEMVVAVLGVMKSGGAFVPLDAAHARQRLVELAQGAAVVLTQESLADDVPGDLAAHVVLLDAGEPSREDGENLAPLARPSSLAYTVYTSGTTGRPKGVMISHASLMNIVHGHRVAYGLDESMAHLQMASFSFDVFTGDLARALGTGGKLVMCPRDLVLLPGELLAYVRRHRANAAEFVPAVLRGLVRQAEDAGTGLDFIRLIAVASDVWYVREYEELRRRLAPRARVSGTYGVTEVNIDSTTFQSAFRDAATSLPLDAYVPAGRPFAGNPLYLLDRQGLAVPPGAVGEMCIGGAGVARGYYGQPAATARKFVPDALGDVPGARIYRTGDRVRSLHDGNVDFLGRVDFQVKIRGFRIEPGEIEASLDEHPDVAQAVVIAREDVPGNRYLAAYVVARPSAARPPEAGELRRFLKERLPDYMVPAVFISLDALPLNENNKVDRRRLPAPAGAETGATEPTAPRTDIEEALAEIFQQVTGAPRVGVGDDFFALGGHSLLATQVISRVRETFEVELPLRTFFELPTVAELGLWIEEALIARVEALSEQEIEALL
jgi:amino acid adenylation domain-containing protein